MPDSITRLLLVDDHAMLIEVLRDRLNEEPNLEVVATCTTGKAAIEQARKLQPDVIMLDIDMAEMDGITATKILKQELPHIRIIALTALDRDDTVAAMMGSGADGYCLKTLDVVALIHAIHLVMQGGMFISPEIAPRLRQILAPPTAVVTASGPAVPLTARELEVLQLVTRGFNNAEIAESLNISVNTVRAHVKSVLGKFGVHDRVSAARIALNMGIISS